MITRQNLAAGKLWLALFVLASAAWQYSKATGPIAEYPLENYCGVGICPTRVPNRFLPAANSSNLRAGYLLSNVETELRANPASPYVWADTAEVLWTMGDLQKAHYCFQQASRAGPRNPNIKLRTNALPD